RANQPNPDTTAGELVGVSCFFGVSHRAPRPCDKGHPSVTAPRRPRSTGAVVADERTKARPADRAGL
ncbi:hypothetical protein, partial [Cellulosimicrobium funkei]|uniref:hypothetical protein n=1 Tax=Cellulosimicrobium funkei TaxID=264251 RepID=UPI003F92A209